jgi:hypothetical protein
MRARPTAVGNRSVPPGWSFLSAFVPLLLSLGVAACGEGEPPPSDPEVVWDMAEPWVYEAGMLLGDDWRFSIAAADSLPSELVERVAEATTQFDGDLRILAVTRGGCIDSAHSIPYLAAVAEAVPGLTMRSVEPRVGRALMEAHPTPDGRAATPTVLVLDELGEVRGCWIERPASVQYWYLENPEDLGSVEKFAAKTTWYEADRGVHAVTEFARVLEAAAGGDRICGFPMDSVPVLPEPGRSRAQFRGDSAAPALAGGG